MTPGPPSSQLSADFRHLLTHGLKAHLEDEGHDAEVVAGILSLTKPWRAQLWAQFSLIDARLNPTKNGGPR